MLSFSTPKLFKIPVILITLGVLIFGFACSGMISHSSIHNTSGTNSVVIMQANSQECCNVSVSRHIESWENIILTVPDKTRDALALLALGLTLILGYSWVSLWNRNPLIEADTGLLCLYIRQNPDLILFNHLKLAFARGILNPKIY